MLHFVDPVEENAKEKEEEVENHLELISCSGIVVKEQIA
jgi:predicted DNA-binding protein with PD1-like motif